MNAKQPTKLDLPNEILEIIFSHLSFKDRVSVTLVCRRWSEFPIPLSEICLSLVSCMDASIFEEFLVTDRPYIHLKLRHNNYTSKLISKFRNSLESLEVEDVYLWDWMNALCGLPKLQHLGMKCPNISAITKLHSTRPCHSMRSLVINECDKDDLTSLNSFISETFPGLTSLRLREYSGDFSISGLTNLEILEVNKISILHDRLLQDLKALPKLRDIKLTADILVSRYPAESLNIDQVQTVALSIDFPIDDKELLQLTRVFPGMTSCYINNRRTRCTVAGIEDVKKRFPKCTFEIGR